MSDHVPIEELLGQQKSWQKKIQIGAAISTTKNHHFYIAESLALREENDSWAVNYRDELSGILFNRRAEIFLQEIADENGKMVPRFKKVQEI